MDNDGKIRYEDLISPDDSIKVLIGQLDELNKTYGATLDVIKSGAKEIINHLSKMSAATAEGKGEIDDAAIAANRLTRAQKELSFAMSDTGKQVAWLKAQTASQNKTTVDVKRQTEALAGSYDKLKSELNEQIALWKSLSDEQQRGELGGQLLDSIIDLKTRLAELDDQLRLHVQNLSAVEKAEQKLAYLRSAEGQQLLNLKRQINELMQTTRVHRTSIDEVAQAQQKLAAAQDSSRLAAYYFNIQAQEANRIAKLTAQLNLSEEGSYNRLAAQYELNKIKLNKMSEAERYATQEGKQLEAETLALYVQMQKMQEAVGNHRLSVGNYARSWDGLGISVSQVVRELPAAAVSMNTFFLGISNNIPILVDEINKLRAENKKAIAEGKQAKSVVGAVAKALFSWNTILVIGLTVLSMHGKAIIDWISKLFKGEAAAISQAEAIDNINKELEKTNGSYGQNIVTLKKLSQEWQNLSTKKEQLQWIKDNKSEFDKLDVSIRNVTDAENVFVENTDAVVEALKLRAKAAAALELASEKYKEALKKEAEAEAESKKGPSFGDQVKNWFVQSNLRATDEAGNVNMSGIQLANQISPETYRQARIKNLEKEAKVAEADGDAYFDLANAREKEAKALLKSLGIESSHKYGRDKKNRERNPRQRDLTDTIWRNDLAIRKKYELSISELQRDEFEKRRIEAVDQANATIREMQEKFRKNQAFLDNKDGKYKPLTEAQKKQIEEQQKEIEAIIINTQRKLDIDLVNLEYERERDKANVLRQAMKWREDIITDSIEKEKELRLQQLNDEEAMYITKAATSEGGEVVVTGQITPEQRARYQREREVITAEYDKKILDIRKRGIDAEIELVEKGTEEELLLMMRKYETELQIALLENRLKKAEEREDEEYIKKLFERRKRLALGQTLLNNFDQAQAQAEAEFNIVKHSENEQTIFRLNQERERWKKQIELAKEGGLDWSEAQIKQAEAMIKTIERKIKEANNFITLISKKGVGGALLTKLGFDDDQIAALSEATKIIIDNIKSIIDAEVKAAEKAVELAEQRVDAAQSAYEAEIEARNNGYANNVATAKKELQLERKNQAQKQKILEDAQRKQERIDTITQASSLVTASANLWSAFSKIPIVGPALAIAAIAAMWTSFAMAKVKAAQITKASAQEYGEGGLEFLQGGSHASGHDIDLQTRNSRGKSMRAEGGEAMAIINRRNTRKYKKLLPDIIESLNKGTFEDKFGTAFSTGDELAQNVQMYERQIDLSRLEEDVRALKRNSEYQTYTLPDGTVVEKRGNVTRRIH